jgi:hypothetical protein
MSTLSCNNNRGDNAPPAPLPLARAGAHGPLLIPLLLIPFLLLLLPLLLLAGCLLLLAVGGGERGLEATAGRDDALSVVVCYVFVMVWWVGGGL